MTRQGAMEGAEYTHLPIPYKVVAELNSHIN